MEAMVLDADDQLHVAEIEQPDPGPDQVAIRVEFAGVQYGDVLVKRGHFPVPRPFVPGFEASGRVIAVGENVTAHHVGDAVAALTGAGAFAEVAVADAALTFGVGDLDLRVAAGFGWVTPTAHALINSLARVTPGESVLIHAAAGGVGSLAVQFARLAGATRLTGVVSTPSQIEPANQFGYDEVILASEFPERVAADQFDVILDPIGGDTRRASLERLAAHGRLVAYGNIATFAPVSVDVNELLMAGRSLLTYNSNLLSQTNPARLANSARAALALVTAGQVRIEITAEYPLSELSTAIERLSDGTGHGKNIIRIT
jgi:NADPH:quinone reductase